MKVLLIEEGGCDIGLLLSAPQMCERPQRRRGAGGFVYLARWPSERAVQHARDRIRFITMCARLVAPVEQVVAEVNLFLRGWAGFFRFGNSA